MKSETHVVRYAVKAAGALCAGCLFFLAAGCAPGSRPPAALLVTGWTFSFEGHDEAVSLPVHLGARLPPREGRYTLRTAVVLPAELAGHDLDVAIPFFAGVTSLTANGSAAIAVDTSSGAGDERGFVRRSSGSHMWTVPRGVAQASGGRLDLELEVRHTFSSDADWDTVPRITLASAPDRETQLVGAFNRLSGSVALVTLTQIALLYLAIYLFDRRRTTYRWFVIQGFSAAFYQLYILGFSQEIFGAYDQSFLAWALVVAPIASVYFTHSLLEMRRPSRLWPALLVAHTALVLATLGPWRALPIAAKSTVLLVGLVCAYQIWLSARLTFGDPMRRPLAAPLVLACWTVLGAMAAPDMVLWFGHGEALGGVRIGTVGLTVFALLQSLILGREHVATLRRSDRLNTDLVGRIELLETSRREIEALNEELRRQIGDRSRQLFAALALTGRQTHAGAKKVLAAGDLVQDRYRIERELGRGGMGAVYQVIRLRDSRKLALKVTHAVDGNSLARLAREAQIAAEVAHPNLVSILDVDVAPSGFVYLVMEYVQGSALSELKARFGDPSFALPVLRDIAAGLAALHARGIVHRDLKPANVLVHDPGDGRIEVKITDFGISRWSDSDGISLAPPPPASPDEEGEAGELTETTGSMAARSILASGSSPLTEEGQIAGTPRYMAPEVVSRDAPLAATVDIFSFGVLAYDLLARQYPFAEPPLHAAAARRPLPRLTPLATLRTDLDGAIVKLLEACLSFTPSARPTAAEITVALERALEPTLKD